MPGVLAPPLLENQALHRRWLSGGRQVRAEVWLEIHTAAVSAKGVPTGAWHPAQLLPFLQL